MTETAFLTQSDEVLAEWDRYTEDVQAWSTTLAAESDRLGRNVYRHAQGLGRRERVVGLGHTGEALEGWVKLKKHDFLVPARGKAGESARRWLEEHQPPTGISERLASYGVCEYFVSESRVYWPGILRLLDGLYVSWGTDTGWDGGEHFRPVLLSEFYAAQEEHVRVVGAR